MKNNSKRKIHNYKNPSKYWDETRTLSTTPRLRGGNAPSWINYLVQYVNPTTWYIYVINLICYLTCVKTTTNFFFQQMKYMIVNVYVVISNLSKNRESHDISQLANLLNRVNITLSDSQKVLSWHISCKLKKIVKYTNMFLFNVKLTKWNWFK